MPYRYEKEIYPPISFETNTRRDFIKASHILAKGLDIMSRQKTVISIMCLQYGDRPDAGKSLVADAMLHFHAPEKDTYDIPNLNHMSLEQYPQQALEKPLQYYFDDKNRKVRIDFTRYDYQSRRFCDTPDHILTMISHSQFRNYGTPDCEIELDTSPSPSQRNQNALHRQWTVRVLTPSLNTKKMQKQMGHLRQFHARRLHKHSLDLQ